MLLVLYPRRNALHKLISPSPALAGRLIVCGYADNLPYFLNGNPKDKEACIDLFNTSTAFIPNLKQYSSWPQPALLSATHLPSAAQPQAIAHLNGAIGDRGTVKN